MLIYEKYIWSNDVGFRLRITSGGTKTKSVKSVFTYLLMCHKITQCQNGNLNRITFHLWSKPIIAPKKETNINIGKLTALIR